MIALLIEVLQYVIVAAVGFFVFLLSLVACWVLLAAFVVACRALLTGRRL